MSKRNAASASTSDDRCSVDRGNMSSDEIDDETTFQIASPSVASNRRPPESSTSNKAVKSSRPGANKPTAKKTLTKPSKLPVESDDASVVAPMHCPKSAPPALGSTRPMLCAVRELGEKLLLAEMQRLRALPKVERQKWLMKTLVNCEVRDNVVRNGKQRQRHRFDYRIRGKKSCAECLLAVSGSTLGELRTLQIRVANNIHTVENPRIGRNMPQSDALKARVAQAEAFLETFAEVNGSKRTIRDRPDKRKHPRVDAKPKRTVTELPSTIQRSHVYNAYKERFDIAALGQTAFDKLREQHFARRRIKFAGERLNRVKSERGTKKSVKKVPSIEGLAFEFVGDSTSEQQATTSQQASVSGQAGAGKKSAAKVHPANCRNTGCSVRELGETSISAEIERIRGLSYIDRREWILHALCDGAQQIDSEARNRYGLPYVRHRFTYRVRGKKACIACFCAVFLCSGGELKTLQKRVLNNNLTAVSGKGGNRRKPDERLPLAHAFLDEYVQVNGSKRYIRDRSERTKNPKETLEHKIGFNLPDAIHAKAIHDAYKQRVGDKAFGRTAFDRLRRAHFTARHVRMLSMQPKRAHADAVEVAP